MDDSKIFDQKYTEYLSQIKDFDFSKKAEVLGIQKRNQSYIFEFFNRQIAFDGNDFTDIEGREVTIAVKMVLCRYVLMCPQKISKSSNKLVTFREFSNAGPLYSSFSANTGKIIETMFSGRLEALTSRCAKLGGTIMETNSYDLCVRFRALHRIPIILNFNDTDERMPAKTVFLYHDNAETFLDLECLTLTCTYLTGMLLQNK
ncbi:MAG: DUF3786 domain-containing protein [Proteobacteria bacterium]|nr:DUF3786 domain-containing protein [Pseudomonadota bacterium]MBU1584570.1 DUF3786 domain-containing protein [Pseudomonadota bacterium]MBU2631084.1 DUF3786 domain-containing protein [Pseudomonadota bacterium]